MQYKNVLGFPLKTTHFCVLIHCSADCCLFPQAICPGNLPLPQKNWFENNRKISITKEICITIDSPDKIPERKSNTEAVCIFKNFTPKQGNSLKILAAGTRNDGMLLPPPPPRFSYRTIYYSIEQSTSCNLSFHSTRPQLQRYLQLSCQVGLAHACSDPVNHQHFEQHARSSIR